MSTITTTIREMLSDETIKAIGADDQSPAVALARVCAYVVKLEEEIVTANGRLDMQMKEIAQLRERKEWWQKNAEAIAKERGELFHAGEAMFRIGSSIPPL